jgi:hypothetical protein
MTSFGDVMSVSQLTQFACAVVIVGMTSSCTQSIAAQFSGLWRLNIERTISINAELQRETQKNPQALAELRRVQRRASFRVFTENGNPMIETNDGAGNVKRSTYRILKEELGQLIISSRNTTTNEARRMEISFFGQNAMEVFLPGQNKRIAFSRAP